MNEKVFRQVLKAENEELMNQLAAHCHTMWSSWMAYQFSLCTEVDGVMIIPARLVERWKRQMSTDYDKLPFDEKCDDANEADEIFNIYMDYLKQ